MQVDIRGHGGRDASRHEGGKHKRPHARVETGSVWKTGMATPSLSEKPARVGDRVDIPDRRKYNCGTIRCGAVVRSLAGLSHAARGRQPVPTPRCSNRFRSCLATRPPRCPDRPADTVLLCTDSLAPQILRRGCGWALSWTRAGGRMTDQSRSATHHASPCVPPSPSPSIMSLRCVARVFVSQGLYYFQCPPNHGLFLRLHQFEIAGPCPPLPSAFPLPRL